MSDADRTCCPACSRRWSHVVALDCPVCEGDGYLTLGSMLRVESAETLARAVEIALELRATHDMQRSRVLDLDRARANLTVMIRRCERAGLLAARVKGAPPGPVPAPSSPSADVPSAAVTLAAGVSGLPADPDVLVRLAAPPVPVGPTPVDGARPGFSRGGYVCFSSRVADAIPALDAPTDGHRSSVYRGDRLGHAMFESTLKQP